MFSGDAQGALAMLTIGGGVAFLLLMVFNIRSFMKYLSRDKSEGALVQKQHPRLFLAVDGFVTFLTSLDFLPLFFLFLIYQTPVLVEHRLSPQAFSVVPIHAFLRLKP